MTKHVSAGGVLVNLQTNKIYLIHKTVRNEWLLPKGHLEQGETPVQAALREIKEETGYSNIKEISEDDFIQKSEYVFKGEDGKDEFKEVFFYLVELADEDFHETRERDAEGLAGDWFDFDAAIEKVAHDDSSEAIRKAEIKLSLR